MSNSSSSSSSSGIGFTGLLAIAFIVLKLCGVISWSWFWVLAPIWGSFALVIAGLILFFVGWVIVAGVKEVSHRRQLKKRRERFALGDAPTITERREALRRRRGF